MKRIWIIVLGVLTFVSCHNKVQNETYNLEYSAPRCDSFIINVSADSTTTIPYNVFSSDWMQKYTEYVRGYEHDSYYKDKRIMDIWPEWGLAYIDDDTIPEMILFCPCEATGNKVLTIHNGKVSEWNSFRCGSSYIPRSGLIENHDCIMGDCCDVVLRLENGVFTEIFNHTDDFIRGLDDERVEYFCHFEGDSTFRIGNSLECGRYRRLKDKIYTSVGKSIKFETIENRLSTDLFAPAPTRTSGQ